MKFARINRKKEPAKFYNYRIKIKLKSDKQLKNYG